MLDEAAMFSLIIDPRRAIEITPTADGQTVVMSVEDTVSVAVVEITQPELQELIDGLSRFRKPND